MGHNWIQLVQPHGVLHAETGGARLLLGELLELGEERVAVVGRVAVTR